jgi:hypothetical protein
MVWRVCRRQSSFWDFESPEHTKRVHFVGKLEHHFVSTHAERIEITDEHPVLSNYKHPWIEIYIATSPTRPSELATALLHLVQAELGAWRSPVEYFNRGYPPRELLHAGFGLLFCGPEPLAALVQNALGHAEVSFTALPRTHKEQSVKALIAGKNFVVARDFRNEA